MLLIFQLDLVQIIGLYTSGIAAAYTSV